MGKFSLAKKPAQQVGVEKQHLLRRPLCPRSAGNEFHRRKHGMFAPIKFIMSLLSGAKSAEKKKAKAKGTKATKVARKTTPKSPKGVTKKKATTTPKKKKATTTPKKKK